MSASSRACLVNSEAEQAVPSPSVVDESLDCELEYLLLWIVPVTSSVPVTGKASATARALFLLPRDRVVNATDRLFQSV